MLYLTIIKNIFHSNLYSYHQHIWNMFDDYKSKTKKECPFQFSIQHDNIYILSDKKPLNVICDYQKTINTDESLINTGWRYEFVINVNPVIDKRGKRVPLKKDEEILKWLCDKDIGSNMIELYVVDKQNIVCYKNKNKITLFKASIKGVLEINDREKFIETYRKGLGKAKRFGFGMFLLRRIY